MANEQRLLPGFDAPRPGRLRIAPRTLGSPRPPAPRRPAVDVDLADRRMYYALCRGNFTSAQAVLLRTLGDHRLGWDELIELARSGARPARSIGEALGALVVRGVVALDDDGKLALADPSEWLERADLEKAEAMAARPPFRVVAC